LAVKPLDKAMEVQSEYAKMAHQVNNPTHFAWVKARRKGSTWVKGASLMPAGRSAAAHRMMPRQSLRSGERFDARVDGELAVAGRACDARRKARKFCS
jgi:hypothetical protein